MSDVEELKKAIETVQAWAADRTSVCAMDSNEFMRRMHLVVQAARSTLPKMKTVEVEQWVVIDRDGDARRTGVRKEAALAYAAEKNASDSIYKPYTVVRLTGTAEIPA